MDDAGDSYVIIDGVLTKFAIKTGETIWQTNLNSVPAQKGGQKASDDSWNAGNPGLEKPNSFEYQIPLIFGSNVLLFRTALAMHGDHGWLVHQDWLRVNRKDGRFVGGGAGEFLGDTRDVALCRVSDRIIGVKEDRFVELDELKGFAERGRSWSSVHEYYRLQHVPSNRCIFLEYANSETRLWIYDSAARKAIGLAPRDRPKDQIEWASLNGNYLRYSSHSKLGSPRGDEEHQPWLEIYDSIGKRLSTSAPTTLKRAKPDFLIFAGTTVNGSVVFRHGDNLLVLQTPLLQVLANYELDPSPQPEHLPPGFREIVMRNGSDVFFQTTAAAWPDRRPTLTAPPEIVIAIRDVMSGKVLRKYSEQIPIKNPNN